MKIRFDFTLDEFQSEALLTCIQMEIIRLTAAKLDYIGSKPHKDHLDGLIKYHKTLTDIIIAGQTRIS